MNFFPKGGRRTRKRTIGNPKTSVKWVSNEHKMNFLKLQRKHQKL